MTNLITILSLVTVTNWTGLTVGTNELGYVTTNHNLTVIYGGTEHALRLKIEPGNVAVWRPEQPCFGTLEVPSMIIPNNYSLPRYLSIWTNQSPWVIPMVTNCWHTNTALTNIFSPIFATNSIYIGPTPTNGLGYVPTSTITNLPPHLTNQIKDVWLPGVREFGRTNSAKN